MTGKWVFWGGTLILAFTVVAMPLQAQRGQGFRGQAIRGQGGPNLGQSLVVALDHQGELNLTQDQLAQLQELKALIDGDVTAFVEEMSVVREGLRGGSMDRAEGVRQLQALRGELMTASAPLRGRVPEILTVEQHNKLQPMVWQGRAPAPGFRRGAPGLGFNRSVVHAPHFRRGWGGGFLAAEGDAVGLL